MENNNKTINIILLVMFIGMACIVGPYAIFSAFKDTKTTTNTTSNTVIKDKDNNTISSIDLTKDLNNTGLTYSNISNSKLNGCSLDVILDNAIDNSITITYTDISNDYKTNQYNVKTKKNVIDAVVATNGISCDSEVIYLLNNDNTVSYIVPDNTYSENSLSTIKDIKSVKDVVRFIGSYATNGQIGNNVVLGVLNDGSFYNLSSLKN